MALEVQIGADSSELNAEIAAAQAKIERLRKEKAVNVKLGLDTTVLQKNINDARDKLTGLRASVETTGKSFSGMQPKIANGGNALMQFSRIAQDAPYGIIGIGNNITATVEAFGHLKQSTGSTGSALKAMAGSIMGSGGILLAVSLVTTAFTYMSMNGLSLGDVIDKMTGKFDSQKKALTDLGIEAAKTAGSEISSLKSLVSVAQDDTKSRKDRLLAVKELQDMYPAYFGNLSTEKILNGDLTGIVRNLSTALRERARASALSDKAGEIAGKELTVQEKLRDVYKEMFKVLGLKDSGKQLEFINALNKEGLSLNHRRFNESKQMSANEVAQMANLKDSYVDLRGELKAIGIEMNHIQNLANSSAGRAVKLLEKKAPISKKATTPEKKQRDQFTSQDFGTTGAGLISPVVPIDLKINQEGISKSFSDFNNRVGKEITMSAKLLEQFSDDLSSIVTNGTVNALSGIGESIGNALASGGNVLDAVGKSLLASMGSMLKELGKATIAYGVGLIAVKMAIKNPYLAVAAGIAMVALGSAMSSSVSKSSSNLGIGGSSPQAGNSYTSPSSSSGGGGSSFQGGTVVFEISGQSLVGVLSNTLDKNKRLGGALAL